MALFFGPSFFTLGKIYNTNIRDALCQFSDLTNTSGYYTTKIDSTENWVDVSYIDTAKHIISGTFQFKVVHDQNPNKKISITEGRFDLKYTPE